MPRTAGISRDLRLYYKTHDDDDDDNDGDNDDHNEAEADDDVDIKRILPLFLALLCSYFSCCCRKIAFFSNSCVKQLK